MDKCHHGGSGDAQLSRARTTLPKFGLAEGNAFSALVDLVGARGGSRTHTPCKGQGILSPQRLPFRHPGKALKVNSFQFK
jgi:hypothetical protein